MVLTDARKQQLSNLLAEASQDLLGASLQNVEAGREATFIKVRAHLGKQVDGPTREFVRGILGIGIGTWKNFESRYRQAHPAYNPNAAGYDPNTTTTTRKSNLVALGEGMENNTAQLAPRFAKAIANHMKSTADLLDGYCHGKRIGRNENGRTMKRADVRHFETGNRIGLNRMQAPTPTKPIKPFNGKKAPRGRAGAVAPVGGAAPPAPVLPGGGDAAGGGLGGGADAPAA